MKENFFLVVEDPKNGHFYQKSKIFLTDLKKSKSCGQ